MAVSGDLKDGSTDVANFDYKVRIDGKEVVGHSGTGTYTGSATSVADFKIVKLNISYFLYLLMLVILYL